MAQTTVQSARSALPENALAPLSTQPPSTLVARVRIAATSEPPEGSVIANAPQRGRSGARNGDSKRRFCSSVPMPSTGRSPRPGPGIAMLMPRSQ